MAGHANTIVVKDRMYKAGEGGNAAAEKHKSNDAQVFHSSSRTKQLIPGRNRLPHSFA